MATINNRPDSATLYYYAAGTLDATTKDYTEGTESSEELTGHWDPARTPRYVIGPAGDVNHVKGTFFADRFSGDTDLPTKGLKLNVNNEDHLVLQFTIYTKHVEIIV